MAAEPKLTVSIVGQIVAFLVGTVGLALGLDARIDAKIEASHRALNLPTTYTGRVELIERLSAIQLEMSQLRAEIKALKHAQHLP